MSIKLLVTGGTLDTSYDLLDGKLTFETTHLPEILRQARSTVAVKLEILALKDSKELTDADRKLILKKCKSAKENKILITHGTDTMALTARILGKNIKNKTIVLTGAMIPFSFANSDVLFNFGCAIMAVQLLPKGVFIVMNGRVFPWNDVRKNKRLGRFENL